MSMNNYDLIQTAFKDGLQKANFLSALNLLEMMKAHLRDADPTKVAELIPPQHLSSYFECLATAASFGDAVMSIREQNELAKELEKRIAEPPPPPAEKITLAVTGQIDEHMRSFLKSLFPTARFEVVNASNR